MATISNVTLQITRDLNKPQYFIKVDYSVTGNSTDILNGQSYFEECHLMGDDTPGDNVDDKILRVFSATTRFFQAVPTLSRGLAFALPMSMFNEDLEGDDEIRAKVSLSPIPKKFVRESNQIVLKDVLVNDP